MLHLSTKNLQRYEFPALEEGGESPLVALFAVPSMAQLAQVTLDIQEIGALPVSPATIRRHLREFLLTIDDDPERARALHLIDAADRGAPPDAPAGASRKRRSATADAKARTAQAAKDAELMARVRRAAHEMWQPYREAVARTRYAERMAAMCYVRRLLRGLEGPQAAAIAFSAPHGIVDDGTLKRLGFVRIEVIGNAIADAAHVSGAVAKN